MKNKLADNISKAPDRARHTINYQDIKRSLLFLLASISLSFYHAAAQELRFKIPAAIR
jgi:hypothetical protein